MASKITDTFKNYLQSIDKAKLAHLVRIELPGDSGNFAYYTDYHRDFIYDNNTFITGKLKSIGDVKQTFQLTSYSLSVKITGADQPELDKAMQSESYLNRKITVWRVFIDDNGDFVPYYEDGSTLKYFEGTINSVSVDENSSATGRGSSTITWKCASEFYDLEKVNGRITDDASHRGLVIDNDGNEVPSLSAKRVEYQDDLGFFHSNQSINILAEYQTREKAFRMKKKSSWFGLKQDYKLVEYWRTVTREVDMRFNLEAKYIPAVYGVQKVQGIPVFADTLVDDPNTVYVVYAMAEGEIDGFLDIYLDDAPMVCFDATDSSDRGCVGRKKELGDTISVAAPVTGDPTDPSTHGQEYIWDDGNGRVNIWTFHGKPDQTAAQELVQLAAEGKFYLQNNGETTYGPEYWDSRFKLLDTAYIVCKFEITDERSNIPTIEAEIQGRKVPTYNESGLIRDDLTSLNPAWQIYDYLTSPIFGAGISPEDIDLTSFIEVAEIFDLQDTSYKGIWAPYWRYIGWLLPFNDSQRWVMQTNPAFETDTTVFKNLDSLLKQTVSSLNIVEGLYTLTVESKKDILKDYTIDDIVNGKITVSDVTSKEKFNSMQASIIDPGLGWQKNDITFYDKDYKIEDNNVEKKGTMQFPYITNYYCARSLAERELRKSRFNKEVTIVLPFREVDLPINSPITLTYERFGWDKKEFLIRDVTFKSDGKVTVKLREYADNVFYNSPQTDKGDDQIPVIVDKVKPPRGLNYVPSQLGDPLGVNGYLRWYPSYTSSVTYYSIRITGQTETITVNAESTDSPDVYKSLAIQGLTEGEYTFAVRAVSASTGFSSSPAVLVVNVDAALNLSRVENFDLTNNAPGDESVWLGGDVATTWDPIPEESEILGIAYEVEVSSSGTVLKTVTVSNAHAYTYTYADNKADYALQNAGAVGVYRDLSIRIRATSPNGGQSVSWTEL